MIPIGGTPKALALMKKLSTSGNLIDIYNRERITALKEPSFVTLEMMDEFDKMHGTNYHHHLLALFVDDAVSGNELIDVYPDFDEKFNDKVYKPNLIFINLSTQQIISYTRVRKGNINSEFIPHPSGIKDTNSTERTFFTDTDWEERQEKLHQLDYADVIGHLSEALEQISNADYNLVYRDIDSGHIDDMLARGPNKHGVYIKDSWGDKESDDDEEDGITQEELDDAKEEIEDLELDLSAGIKTIADFFAQRSVEMENFLIDD
jgi:hypothetical protein